MLPKARAEILAINPFFTEHIISIQQVMIEDEDDYFAKHQDSNPFPFSTEKKFIKGGIYLSNKSDPFVYLNHLGESLEALLQLTDQHQLLILGELPIPWLCQENDYPPVNRAIEFLQQHIDPEFRGGFVLEEGQILEFIPHLFWLTRCNAGLPLFWMAFNHGQTIMSLCKHGGLHFDFYQHEEQQIIHTYLKSNGFHTVKRCADPINFDNFEGRQLRQ